MLFEALTRSAFTRFVYAPLLPTKARTQIISTSSHPSSVPVTPQFIKILTSPHIANSGLESERDFNHQTSMEGIRTASSSSLSPQALELQPRPQESGCHISQAQNSERMSPVGANCSQDLGRSDGSEAEHQELTPSSPLRQHIPGSYFSQATQTQVSPSEPLPSLRSYISLFWNRSSSRDGRFMKPISPPPVLESTMPKDTSPSPESRSKSGMESQPHVTSSDVEQLAKLEREVWGTDELKPPSWPSRAAVLDPSMSTFGLSNSSSICQSTAQDLLETTILSNPWADHHYHHTHSPPPKKKRLVTDLRKATDKLPSQAKTPRDLEDIQEIDAAEFERSSLLPKTKFSAAPQQSSKRKRDSKWPYGPPVWNTALFRPHLETGPVPFPHSQPSVSHAEKCARMLEERIIDRLTAAMREAQDQALAQAQTDKAMSVLDSLPDDQAETHTEELKGLRETEKMVTWRCEVRKREKKRKRDALKGLLP